MEEVNKALRSFDLGSYVGLVATGGNETDFLNEIINVIIEDSTFVFDDDWINQEIPRIEADLRKALEADKKPVTAFCYLQRIQESELGDYCRNLFMRTTAENMVITAVAEAEHIKVTKEDIATYMKNYRLQYANLLMSEPEVTEDDLHNAIKTKKVLRFLLENNTWNKGIS